MAQISPWDLGDKGEGVWWRFGEAGAILEMAFNMAQWPCRGIRYGHWQKKASIVQEPASFGKLFHFLINCALIKIKGRRGERGRVMVALQRGLLVWTGARVKQFAVVELQTGRKIRRSLCILCTAHTAHAHSFSLHHLFHEPSHTHTRAQISPPDHVLRRC